jgi:hypothetical protein
MRKLGPTENRALSWLAGAMLQFAWASLSLAQVPQQAPSSALLRTRPATAPAPATSTAIAPSGAIPGNVAPSSAAPASLNWGGAGGNATSIGSIGGKPASNTSLAGSRFGQSAVAKPTIAPGTASNASIGSTSASDPSQFPFDLPTGPSKPYDVDGGRVRYDFPFVRAKDGSMHILDACKTPGSSCGAPVAQEFCQSMRTTNAKLAGRAVDFKSYRGTGRDGRTASLSQTSCSGSTCSAFFYVVCQ